MIEIGNESASTPVARMGLPAQVVFCREWNYSSVILWPGPRGSILETFGGGSGTLATYSWPTGDVFGTRSRDGRIRVLADTLDQMTTVPFGTLVLVNEE